MNNSYITIIKEKRTDLSRKRIPLNQNKCTADFRMSVPFEQNLQVDGDTDGLEKVPMFLSTDKETVRQNSRMYLSEIISNYYRLYSKEPMSQNATDSIEIHCPLCGAVLRQMAQNHDANKLGLYTCDRCRQ